MKLVMSPLKDVTEERSCGNKVRYQNMKHCVNALKSFKKMRKYRYQPFTTIAYHCQFCDGWHIGDKRKS